MASSWLGITLMVAVVVFGLIISVVTGRSAQERKASLIAFVTMLIVLLIFILVVIVFSLRDFLPVFIIACIVFPVLAYYLTLRSAAKKAMAGQGTEGKQAAKEEVVKAVQVEEKPQQKLTPTPEEKKQAVDAEIARRQALAEKKEAERKKEEELHQAEITRQVEEARKKAETDKAEADKVELEAEQARKQAEAEAEEARKQTELEAEQARKQAEADRVEADRKAEETRKAEQAEAEKAKEEARKQAEAEKAEAARKVQEETARKKAEAEKAEVARKAEEVRKAEEARKAEQAAREQAAREQAAREQSAAKPQSAKFFEKAQKLKDGGNHSMAARLYLESAHTADDAEQRTKAQFEALSSYIKANDLDEARKVAIKLADDPSQLSTIQVKKLETILKML